MVIFHSYVSLPDGNYMRYKRAIASRGAPSCARVALKRKWVNHGVTNTAARFSLKTADRSHFSEVFESHPDLDG